MNASITRGANTYGPNQYPEKLVPLFVTNALDGQPLPVYGDGKQVREWLHAEDHCAAIELVLREGAPGEVYNVGGEEHENIEVTHRILELTGGDPSLDPARRGSRRPRPPLRARRREATRRSAGRPSTRSASAGCARRSTGIARTATGGSRSRRASTARTTRRSTRSASRLEAAPVSRAERLMRHAPRHRRLVRRRRPSRRGGRGARRRRLRRAAVFVVDGGGWGHGVGMSQWGAYGQALEGRTYDRDPRRYYPGTSSSTRPSRRVRVLVAAGGEDAPCRVQGRVPRQGRRRGRAPALRPAS